MKRNRCEMCCVRNVMSWFSNICMFTIITNILKEQSGNYDPFYIILSDLLNVCALKIALYFCTALLLLIVNKQSKADPTTQKCSSQSATEGSHARAQQNKARTRGKQLWSAHCFTSCCWTGRSILVIPALAVKIFLRNLINMMNYLLQFKRT